MIQIKGKYGEARVFTDDIGKADIDQIKQMLNCVVAKDANMRIMPDVHAGIGCVIGTTMKIVDKVVPYFIGVDIGCGMLVYQLKTKLVNLKKLDGVIHKNVPSGFNNRKKAHRFAKDTRISELRCKDHLKNYNTFDLAIGTLGGGNHFIELGWDLDNDDLYLVIHSGSRNLGKQVADYYQDAAYQAMIAKDAAERMELIDKLKAENRHNDIAAELGKAVRSPIEKNMAYLEGQLMDDYLHDMQIAQEYASLNRKAILDVIQHGMGWDTYNIFETIHNYIDIDSMILRKGAVSAKKGERLLIPMNMSWGSVIATGKGNKDWNESCAHGAGRTMSRTEAKKRLSMKDYSDSMVGIYSTCVVDSTIDESPMAYKNPWKVLDNLKDTVDFNNVLKALYNFKAKDNKKETNK